MCGITVSVQTPQRLSVKVQPQAAINATLENVVVGSSDYAVYDGELVVTPLAKTETVLKTKERVLLDDITVEKVPYFEVSNDAGGSTCYIGEVL